MSAIAVPAPTCQVATCIVDGRLYGIDVANVQEVAQAPRLTRMRLAPPYVLGLLNLRGHIATAVGLRELFGAPKAPPGTQPMTLVCQLDHALISLFVDHVGDVVALPQADVQPVPPTIAQPMRTLMAGVWMHGGELLSLICIHKIFRVLNAKEDMS